MKCYLQCTAKRLIDYKSSLQGRAWVEVKVIIFIYHYDTTVSHFLSDHVSAAPVNIFKKYLFFVSALVK